MVIVINQCRKLSQNLQIESPTQARHRDRKCSDIGNLQPIWHVVRSRDGNGAGRVRVS